MRRDYPVAVLVLMITLTSCGDIPYTRIYGGDSEANVKWTSGGADSSAVQSSKSSPLFDGTSMEGEVSVLSSVAEYDDYYTDLGVRKFAYTPESFELWSWTVISNPDEFFELTMYWDECNYAAPDLETEPKKVTPGFYDILFITVANANGTHAHNGREFVPRNSIKVSMPEYAGGILPDKPHYDGINMNVEFLGGDRYHFSWIEIIPQPPEFRDINFIIFGPFDNKQLFVSNSYDTSIFTGNEDYGSSGTNQTSILIPWKGVTVGANNVQFQVALDLTEIIEVYEGSTAVASDDVVVLANNFWERFSIRVVEN